MDIKAIEESVKNLCLDKYSHSPSNIALEYIQNVKSELLGILKNEKKLNVYETLGNFLKKQWTLITNGQFSYHLMLSEPVSLCLYKIAESLCAEHNSIAYVRNKKSALEFLIQDSELVDMLRTADRRFTQYMKLEELMCSHWAVIDFLKYFKKRPLMMKKIYWALNKGMLPRVFESAVSQREWCIVTFMLNEMDDKTVFKDEISFAFEYAAAYSEWDFLIYLLKITDERVLSQNMMVSIVCENAAKLGRWNVVVFMLGLIDHRMPDQMAATSVLRNAVQRDQLGVINLILSLTGNNRPMTMSVKKILDEFPDASKKARGILSAAIDTAECKEAAPEPKNPKQDVYPGPAFLF